MRNCARPSSTAIRLFRSKVYGYYRKHGRDLPWRHRCTPYRVLVSEIMLQQTQAERVIPKFASFTQRFPDFRSLVKAPLSSILAAWQGLGYNRRALSLKKLAVQVCARHGGFLPRSAEELNGLPGIGSATAGAVMAFAFNRPAVFIETNIRSVFIHHFFPGKRNIPDSRIAPLVELTLDRKHPRRWYSALMDYGVFLKRRYPNPSRKSAHHRRQGRFEGSDRQLRGIIVRMLLQRKRAMPGLIYKSVRADKKRVRRLLDCLLKEGLAKKQGPYLTV